MKKTANKKWLAVPVLGLAALLFLITAFSQKVIIRQYYDKTDKLEGSAKLMLLSDLHATYYGKNQGELIGIIEEENPDAILFSGDILDDERENSASLILLEYVGGKYPCYYVSGNHEWWSGQIEKMKDEIAGCNVKILEGTSEVLRVNNRFIRISGIDDPELGKEKWLEQLAACEKNINDNLYNVLLTHRPEEALRYQGYDLILSGHTHGGILRVPGILNGFYAPNQGFFPEFAGGRYDFDDTVMIVSRGLSKSLMPRIFTRPEVVIININ